MRVEALFPSWNNFKEATEEYCIFRVSCVGMHGPGFLHMRHFGAKSPDGTGKDGRRSMSLCLTWYDWSPAIPSN